MKTSINYIIAFFLVATLMSCSQGETLQSYFVEKQEKPNFMSIDIPLSFIDIEKTELTEVQQEAYESINKLNMLGYRLNEDNQEEYKTELAAVRTLLKNEKYQELFRGGNNTDGKVVVKYIGDDTTIDELIVLGTMPERGFAVVRVLGDEMEPAKIMKLGNVVSNFNSSEKITRLFQEEENNPVMIGLPSPNIFPKEEKYERRADLINQFFVEIADNGITKIDGLNIDSITEGIKLIKIEGMEEVDQISSEDVPEFTFMGYVG